MMTEWGYSESPLVDGNLLICTPGGEKGTLAALDKNTGAVVWQSKSQTNKAPYTSPMLATIQGVKQYVQTSYLGEKNGGVISGYDAKDGKVLWTETLAKKASYSIASTPLIVGDKVYVSEGNGYGCHYFKFGAGFKAKDAYSKSNQKVMKNNHGGVVLVDGHVYGFGEPGMWICQDLETGAELWSERSVIPGRSGSLTAAEGLLYLYSDEGEVGLVAANPKEFQLVKSFTIPEKSKYPATRATSRASKVWAHPVIANGRLYLRDSELVFCYDIRGK
jgi:outer membrane protein assembly factor BamB